MGRTQGLLVMGMAALALVGCGGDEFKAEMTGAKERPNPVSTNATGEATAKLDDNLVTVTGTFEGLSGPAVAAHIHGPSSEEEAAGILCELVATNGVAGTLSGTCNFSDDQTEQLRDGLMYVNVHTPQYPAGEIRGQLE